MEVLVPDYTTGLGPQNPPKPGEWHHEETHPGRIGDRWDRLFSLGCCDGKKNTSFPMSKKGGEHNLKILFDDFLHVQVGATFFLARPNQWPFQEPKLEVPTIYKAYFSGLCKGISPQNIARNMVQYLHFRILKISHWPNRFGKESINLRPQNLHGISMRNSWAIWDAAHRRYLRYRRIRREVPGLLNFWKHSMVLSSNWHMSYYHHYQYLIILLKYVLVIIKLYYNNNNMTMIIILKHHCCWYWY